MGKRFMKVFIVVIVSLFIIIGLSIKVNANIINEEEQVQNLLDIKEEKQPTPKEDYERKYSTEKNGRIAYIMHEIIVYNIITVLITLITSIISLTLNCIRKNVGKAIFSGIAIVIPSIAYIIFLCASALYAMNEGVINIVIFFMAFLLEIIVEILAIIFCFSKKTIKE